MSRSGESTAGLPEKNHPKPGAVINSDQREAICHGSGPMLVLAGPGSGKTSVITSRTLRLIQHENAAPSSVLVVTFTRAAAGQMKERFLTLSKGRYGQVLFGTFHGVFYGILKQAYHLHAGSIIGEQQRTAVLRELLHHAGMETGEERDLPELVKAEISHVKTEQIDPEHFYSSCCPAETFRGIYRSYHETLRKKRMLDFDDILTECFKLLTQRPDILAYWQDRFRYILIDEFQDISPLQYRIIRMLAAPQNHIFVVGDDDQSIYRFRGAGPETLFRFQKDYPDCRTVILHQNYRCSGAVVKESQRLIRHNRKRFEKELVTENAKGEPVEMCAFSNEDEETLHIVRKIRHYTGTVEKMQQEDGIRMTDGRGQRTRCRFADIAVLFRTTAGCRRTVSRFMEYGIPFVMKDSVPNLYDHWIARQLLAYLRIANGGRERGDFFLIMNRPNRYLHRAAVSGATFSFDELFQFYEDREWMWERIDNLQEDLDRMNGMPPFAAVTYIRCGIGYDAYLKDYAAAHQIPEEELFDVIDEIQSASRGFRTFSEWCAFIQDYTIALKRKKPEEKPDGVVISTLHGAKGLEYRHVFLPDINEGILPYKKAHLEEEIEEERRLLYVGMTRAKESLHLFWIRERYKRKQEPSRFLRECEEITEEEETCGSRRQPSM